MKTEIMCRILTTGPHNRLMHVLLKVNKDVYTGLSGPQILLAKLVMLKSNKVIVGCCCLYLPLPNNYECSELWLRETSLLILLVLVVVCRQINGNEPVA